MTIKPEVLAAMNQLDDLANAGEWLTSDDMDAAKLIRAELLAMDAEIGTLRATISKCAAAAGEIVMPSCSVEFLKQVPDEIDDVCREFESKIAASESELTEALKDARRYRWLRGRNVGDGRLYNVIHDDAHPGYQGFKYEEELDQAIDDAIDAMNNSAR